MGSPTTSVKCIVLEPGAQPSLTGSELHCKDWHAEAALRMFLNNLHADVAERPEDLVVYGGTGRAARDWESAQRIVDTLQRLEPNETMMVQSGKPVAVFQTHTYAPKVLIANSNLVGKWANWEHFRDLADKGLMMYGQMTAGSWIYIGTQGILQGTYETLAALANKRGGTLKNTLTVTAGLGGMGGAQPLAVTMNEGTCLIADVEQARIDFRLRTQYLDEQAEGITAAIDRALEAKERGEAVSVGVCCNATELLEALLERNITPEVLTDQTSAHDPLNGYVPDGMTLQEAEQLRTASPDEYQKESFRTMGRHVELMLDMQKRGAETFDYGNNLRAFAQEEAGVGNAFDFPGFVPAYIRPLFCEGMGPFRWAALSGDPEDIRKTDEAILRLFPEKEILWGGLKLAGEKISFQGLPSRICWLGYGERAKAGLEFNRMVRDCELSAPIVLGRDHLDCGSVASPNRETEAMKDGTDAVADWPLLNGMLAVASGASWVSMHHGGGVGIGYSQHSGQVCLCDGTPEADVRLRAVLTNDPGLGVVRHVDAGYEEAIDCMKERGVDVPS
ncbi:MAG: urocanate hydratase [Planctomycetes bacterium]|nr:urocanate hydratase [Planctomycetota bacterium]